MQLRTEEQDDADRQGISLVGRKVPTQGGPGAHPKDDSANEGHFPTGGYFDGEVTNVKEPKTM